MKKVIIITGVILLVVNTLFGLIITAYPMFNVGINSVIIIGTTALLFSLQMVKMKGAFAISLSFLFSFLGVIEFVLGCFAPQQFEDNWYLIVVITILAFEGIFLLITHMMSK